MVSPSISHYRILKKLGAGGVGEVYLAEETSPKRNLATRIASAEFATYWRITA